MSEQLLEMTSLCANTGIETLSLPLIHYFIYYTLMEADLRVHQPLPQHYYFHYWHVVDSFLHHYRNAVVNHIKIRAGGQPHVES